MRLGPFLWPVLLLPYAALPLQPDADVPDDVAAWLEAIGHRTYAPATEKSRAGGAGAGPDDND